MAKTRQPWRACCFWRDPSGIRTRRYRLERTASWTWLDDRAVLTVATVSAVAAGGMAIAGTLSRGLYGERRFFGRRKYGERCLLGPLSKWRALFAWTVRRMANVEGVDLR